MNKSKSRSRRLFRLEKLEERAMMASSDPQDIVAVGSLAFFTADDGIHGRELWVSNGETGATQLVKDINAGQADSRIHQMTAVGNTLFFVADNGTHGWELWKSNGTAAGTVLVKDINPGSNSSQPNELTAIGNTLY